MRGVTIGRHFNEGDKLWVAIPEDHVKEFLNKYVGELSSDEVETLNEVIGIMRKKQVMWGI